MTIIEEMALAKQQRDAECSAKEAAQQEVITLKAQLAEQVKVNGELAGKIKAGEEALTAEKTAHEATKGELHNAKAKLENPAFGLPGTKAVASIAPDASSVSAVETKIKTQAEWLAEYEKIPETDAKARAEFRKAHGTELGIPAKK